MQQEKEVVFYGSSEDPPKRGPVEKFIETWDTESYEKFKKTIIILQQNPIQKCCENKKLFEKVKGYQNRTSLYELKVRGHQKKQYRLLFVEKQTMYGNIIYFLHGYIEKGRGHLKNEYETAFKRTRNI